MRILGIESSADETSAAVVESDGPGGVRLLSNVIQSQIDIHKVYGGIVPEISARSHIEAILPVIEAALQQSLVASHYSPGKGSPKLETGDKRQATQSDPWNQIDAIAVTYAPGLVGSLLMGVMTARTLALIKKKPLYPIHHVKAHVYANFINPVSHNTSGTTLTPRWRPPTFPILALIVSGGHTQLVLFESHQQYKILGRTQDDAVGEAFDKVAKILGLPYPGGPSIQAAAAKGDSSKYTLPKAKMKNNYDFSFSGLKTAFLRRVQREVGVDITFPSHELSSRLSTAERYDFAASFQQTAVETLVDKTIKAYQEFSPASVVIAGGVAANQALRRQLSDRLPIKVTYPPIWLCTDNGAMIASAAYYESQFRQPCDPRDLEVVPSLSM